MMIKPCLPFLLVVLASTSLPVVADTPQNAVDIEKPTEAPPSQAVNEFSNWEIGVSSKAFYAWRFRGDNFERKLSQEVVQHAESRGGIPMGLRCIVAYTLGFDDHLEKFSIIHSSNNERFDQLVLDVLLKRQQGDSLKERRPGRSFSRAVELCSEDLFGRDFDLWWPWQRKIIEKLDYQVSLSMPKGTQSVPSQRCVANFVVTSDGKVEYIGTASLLRNQEFLGIVEAQTKALEGNKILKFPDGVSEKFRLISTEVYFRPLRPYKEQPILYIGDFDNR